MMATLEPALGVTCSCEHPFTGEDPACPVCGPAGIRPQLKRFDIFSNALCARALRHLASIGQMPQAELMKHYHGVVGGKGQFTFAFGRFRCHRYCGGRKGRDFGCDADVRHLIVTERLHAGSRANRVLWIGAPPAEWIASLSDNELGKAFESLERQFLLEIADAEETRRWLVMVVDAMKARGF